MHTVLLASAIVAFSVVLSVLGLLATRRLVKPSTLRQHHDVAGFLIAIVGLIYGVLQAFVVFVVWTQYQNASAAVENEANCATDIYHISYGFPAEQQTKIRTDIRQYVGDVVTYEWPSMQQGKPSPIAERSLDRLWYTFSTIDPTTPRENTLYQEGITRLNDLGNSRRERLLSLKNSVPDVMWFVLVFGGLATIAFTYFFGAENGRAQALMTALLTALIALVLFLIAAIEYPFGSYVHIQPDAFNHVTSRFTDIETHEKERVVEKTKTRPNPN